MKDIRDSILKLAVVLCTGTLLNLPCLAAASDSNRPAADWRERMRTLGTLHDEPNAQPFQKLKLYLAYMHARGTITNCCGGHHTVYLDVLKDHTPKSF